MPPLSFWIDRYRPGKAYQRCCCVQPAGIYEEDAAINQKIENEVICHWLFSPTARKIELTTTVRNFSLSLSFFAHTQAYPFFRAPCQDAWYIVTHLTRMSKDKGSRTTGSPRDRYIPTRKVHLEKEEEEKSYVRSLDPALGDFLSRPHASCLLLCKLHDLF